MQGTEVMGSDLRATAALAIAGLSANGKTIVRGLDYLEEDMKIFKKNDRNWSKDIKEIKNMFKKLFFYKSNMKIDLKKYKLALIFPFMVGLVMGSIPFIYKFKENYRIQKLIQEKREIEIKNQKKICKADNSDYKKFLNLGFPKTALEKFNLCMKKK